MSYYHRRPISCVNQSYHNLDNMSFDPKRYHVNEYMKQKNAVECYTYLAILMYFWSTEPPLIRRFNFLQRRHYRIKIS